MQLRDMYKSDINRDINGVIKVAQDDEHSIVQELSEYVITKELRRHFNTFLNHYEQIKLVSGFLVSLEAVNLIF